MPCYTPPSVPDTATSGCVQQHSGETLFVAPGILFFAPQAFWNAFQSSFGQAEKTTKAQGTSLQEHKESSPSPLFRWKSLGLRALLRSRERGTVGVFMVAAGGHRFLCCLVPSGCAAAPLLSLLTPAPLPARTDTSPELAKLCFLVSFRS